MGKDDVIDSMRYLLNKRAEEMYQFIKGEWEMEGLRIKRVLFRNPATIVWWQDGSKTVVRCGEGEAYDKEKGILWAFYKRHSGMSNKRAKKQMNKFVERG